MSNFSMIFYTIALFIGFLTVYLAYRLNRTYRLSYLTSYLYFLIAFNIMGFLNHLGRYLGASLFRNSPEETLVSVRYLFAFLAFPFVAFSIYLFFTFANDLIGSRVSTLFNRLFGLFWGTLFLVQVFLAKNYFNARDENTLLFFSHAINILGIVSFFLIPFYILLRSKGLSDSQQKNIARSFSLIYLLCFGTASLITSPFIVPYLSPYTTLIMIFSFFAVNLPPLFYLILSLRKHTIKIHRPIQKSDLDNFYIFHKISKREKEIIDLILEGMSNADIEKALYISPHTVKNHIYNIYQKLGVKNRVQISNLIRDHNHLHKD
ncbi:MAG: helix-turn-helix transcriptional regulator [Candidatus Aminicenantes bacterium]|jgi:DNA-binding CsgD family transcriptional regulator